MIIYDQTTLGFIHKTEEMLRQVIQETGLTVRRQRFEMNRILYPVRIVVYEGGSDLAHFNAPYFQIGLNRKLIYSAKDSVLRDILRHEFAHYLTTIIHGQVQAHGPEFQRICREFGFPEEIASATMNLALENEQKVGDLASERVLEKVKKLLQLAQSSNAHEAELATLKANELLLRHNLDFIGADDEPIYLARVCHQKRKDAKMVAIYDILRHFIVRTVISQGRGASCLEVSGSLTNVRLAEYVAGFLERELDHLWHEARLQHGLSGLRAKNSFFTGVAAGFDLKMKGVKTTFTSADQKSLVVLEKSLLEKTNVIYRRLSTSSSSAISDGVAKGLGVEKGRSLNIRQGVEGKNQGNVLTWRPS